MMASTAQRMRSVDVGALIDDTTALTEIAARIGITIAQARMVAAAIGDLPVEQAYRLCGMAYVRRAGGPR